MSILSTFYSIRGAYLGQPLIIETGLCTHTEVSNLQTYENGRIVLQAVRRSTGLIVKARDGQSVSTKSITDNQIGSYNSCCQIGKTQFEQVAPSQPFGTHQGQQILRYTRQWVPLDA